MPSLFLVLFAALLAHASPHGMSAASAQVAASSPASQAAAKPLATASSISADLDRIERRLADPRLTDADFNALRLMGERLREAATQTRTAQRAEAQEAQTLLDALGPPPAAGTRESPSVTETRRQLNARTQRATDGLKEIDLAMARLLALQDRVASEGRQQFTRQLVYRGPALLGATFWGQASADIPATWDESLQGLMQPENLPGLPSLLQALLAAGTVLLLWIPLNLLRRRHGVDFALPGPLLTHRSVAALLQWLHMAAVPAAALWAAYGVLNANGWLEREIFGAVVAHLGFGISLALLSLGVARAALAPQAPGWALIKLGAAERGMLFRRLYGFALLAVLGAPPVVMLTGPNAASGARDAIFVLLTLYFCGFALAVSQRRIWAETAGDRRRLGIAWGLALAASALATLAALLGFHSFARFLASGLLLTLLTIATYLLVRQGLREALRDPESAADDESEEVEQSTTSKHVGSTARFVCGLMVDLVLLLIFVTVLALIWGLSPATLGSVALDLIYGVKVGSVTISLLDIVAAILLLGVGVALTRFISNGLNIRLERQTQIDPGVRNSVVTGVAYIGYVISGILGVAVLGLDLSNLAIIAGALSVGIGFGLQNIVNNFVSGLILLIERPVKVGDWVVVGNREGYVRRINVRSTELETFPRASVIIPNSELISSSVMNWTHRDRFGRIDIDIGLSYGIDIDKAEAMLLDCVKNHPEILAYPPPGVTFRSFGDNALQFAVRGHIANVERRAIVESAVRKEIYKTCQRENIGIPYAQSDVHLVDLDRIEQMLKQLLPGGSGKPGDGKARDDSSDA
ncbi:DUF3772 domain-containing protein [Ferrovibrio sp.]|uniref:DUF3772 domain-containing protein n=1 Tax=Ferrovibrio sp. TaxID=1917215 RepID=UPI0025B9E113|nr:DUF3772 domain-containing protein [Ferrovibrio sp.]MBX3454575.1 mechanosensitive ion channel family protein [Ferrovibrio sp.]